MGRRVSGNERRRDAEIAEPIDPGLFESLIRASAPTIVSRVEYDAKIKELMSEMDLSKREEEETNIYGVKMKKRTERVAELRAENPTAEEEEKKAKKKTYDLEIFNGPFKGFHGNVVERLEDGVVRAEVVIFGKNKHGHAGIVRVSRNVFPVEMKNERRKTQREMIHLYII